MRSLRQDHIGKQVRQRKALVEKKYRMYIVNMPSTQFDPRALTILLHVTGST